LLAEYFHFSGVLATVAAGLLMGNLGVLREPKRNIISPDGRAFVVAVWEFAAFIANSLVFLLIGLRVASIPFTGLGATALSVAVGLVLAGRVFTVYPLCLLFRRSAWACVSRTSFGGVDYAVRSPWHWLSHSRRLSRSATKS
jgi:CPA1 family monovalent cation:H+ antiporter